MNFAKHKFIGKKELTIFVYLFLHIRIQECLDFEQNPHWILLYVRTPHHGVVVNIMNCNVIESEFELQSHYYIHFQTWGKYELPCMKVDMVLNKETKLNHTYASQT